MYSYGLFKGSFYGFVPFSRGQCVRLEEALLYLDHKKSARLVRLPGPCSHRTHSGVDKTI